MQGVMERMFSIPLVMLSRVRSSGVNDLSRIFLNGRTMWWRKEWRKMVYASMVVMGGSHNCSMCLRVERASWNCWR